jgi:hypothetical protein
MLSAILAFLSFFGPAIPPVNPQPPQIVIQNFFSVTANTPISSSITVTGPPKLIGYSPWFGIMRSLVGDLSPTAGAGASGGASAFVQ